MPGKYRELVREARHIHALRKAYRSFVGINEGDRYHYLHLPGRVWSTKSHEFWVLLSLILHRVQPGRLLELGSGRSTVYLSEYAMKRGAELVSVDQSAAWIAVNKLIARFGGLPDAFLHEVPLQSDGFYDVAELKSLSGQPDFVLIDGPVGRGTTQSQMACLADLVSRADIVVLDDVHRRHILEQVDALADAGDLQRARYIEYPTSENAYPNALCLLYGERVAGVVEEAIEFVGIEAGSTYGPGDCPEP